MASRRAPHRTRIDWQDAFAFYVALDPDERTVAKVAKRYGVHESSVRKRAKRDGWAEFVEAADAEARAEAARAAIRPRSERIADTIQLVDAARVRYARQLVDGEKVKGSELVGLLRVEQVLEGEGTDRVDTKIEIRLAFDPDGKDGP